MKNYLMQIMLIISFVAFSGCKTTKFNTRETTKSKTEFKADIREEIKVLEETKTTGNISQLVEELTNIIERIITVKLSTPDSVGVQYPIEVTTTEREYSKGKTVRYDAVGTTEQKVESKVLKTDNSQIKIHEESEKIDRSVVKKCAPTWLILSIMAGISGVLLAAFIFFKKIL